MKIVFETDAYATGKHFGVPRAVLRQLGIGQGEAIHLVVDGDRFQWEGTTSLASGEEVYHRRRDPSTYWLEKIRPRQHLVIAASKPDSTG